MTSQKHLFDLPDNIHYLNGAYMSPIMKSVFEAGITGMNRKMNPWTIQPEDFFSQAELVKEKFGKIIHADPKQIAIVPSASYGLKAAIDNIPLSGGSHVVTIANEFPSDYYTILEWCKKNQKELRIIAAPETRESFGADWTASLLDAIKTDTAAVVISTIHWTYGTRFNLKAIGEKCRTVNARFIADGTQSVGALPIDVKEYKIDALVCAAYKWLLGPYSIGLAYYDEVYNYGTPIEDSWMNRANASDFSTLSNYVDEFKPGAARYNVGEFSNHILIPMLDRSLQQLNEWGIQAVQEYCTNLIQPLLTYLKSNNYWIEQDDYRVNHLFGILLPPSVNKTMLVEKLKSQNIFVSVRGNALRISPNVYNTKEDIEALISALQS